MLGVPSTQSEEIGSVEAPQNLKDLTVKELKSMCKDLGLKGYSRLNEDELIELIEGV